MKLTLVLALVATIVVAAQAFTLDIEVLKEEQPDRSEELMRPQPGSPPKSPIEIDLILSKPQQPAVRPRPGESVRPQPQPQPQPQPPPPPPPQPEPSAISSILQAIADKYPKPRPQPNEAEPVPIPGDYVQLPPPQKPYEQPPDSHGMNVQLENVQHPEHNHELEHTQEHTQGHKHKHTHGVHNSFVIPVIPGLELPKPKYPHGVRQ